jgi:hypothetical protein
MRVGTRVINRNSINTYSMCQECTVRVRTALIDQIVPSLSESKVERDVAAIISKRIYENYEYNIQIDISNRNVVCTWKLSNRDRG